jgi:excisionase family DNA binding protein
MPVQSKTNSEKITIPRKVCDQQYFSVATVAKRFEISEKTVRRMIAESRIKAKRIRGSIRISHEELEKLIREY